MDFGFTEKEEAFRQEVRSLLTEVLPSDWAARSTEWPGGHGTLRPELNQTDQAIRDEATKRIRDKGWHLLGWPEEWTRGKHSAVELAIFSEELFYQRGPGLPAGILIAGPTILAHGTDENMKDWLPPILKGEMEFFLAYSEPNFGSDLGGIETRAVEEEDCFVLNGQKIWSTLAHRNTHAWLVARTDPDISRKHRGLSLFVVDNRLPGVTIRPIINIVGLHHFNEVFYDNVRVPKNCLVGQKNHGFLYMTTALTLERLLQAPIGAFERVFEEIADYARKTKRNGEPLSKDPQVRRKLAQLASDIEIARLFFYRIASLIDKGKTLNVEASILALLGHELSPRMANVAEEILGLYGLLSPDSKWAPLYGKVEYGFLDSFSSGIGAGTNEIQRTIIATRGLGLPRD